MLVRWSRVGTIAASAALLACSDGAGPDDAGSVTVRFALTNAQPGAVGGAAVAAGLPLTRDNGTLTIQGIWLVVDELTLERVENACEESVDEGADDACERFELAPFFVPVLLDEGNVGDVTAEVPPGTYGSLKLETKAPHGDGSLLDEIREDYVDWPDQASLLVVGTFAEPGEDADALRAYFGAEVKFELAYPEDAQLVIADGGDATVTVSVNPAVWFANGDTVDDLRMYDYDLTGEVSKFEAKFADGFTTKIELDD